MHSKKAIPALTVAAIGVVFGDIGTSPLYALKEIFSGHHPIPVTPANVLGVLSLVFWSLMVLVTLKYVAIIMRADNRGEGGSLALLALVTERSRNPRVAWVITLLGIFAAALFYGDSMITPAISVLSAVEGLEIATPALKPYVIPITLVILTFLFFIQRRGTGTVGLFFGPVMIAWFGILGAMGIAEIVHHPEVLAALNPTYAAGFVASHPALAFLALGSVVLAVTGGEALYTDMGHFGRFPIRLAWFGFVLPALVLNYFGQGALILGDAEAAKNPFYLSAPEWALYPLIGLATLATVIASQAVISGAFSVTRQAMQLGFVPRLEVQHTSEKQQGQIYLPAVNWGLMVAVMILVLGFKSSNNLAAAYGIAVTGDMVITSLLATVVVARAWGWGWPRSIALFSCFLAVELVFLAANILKIPDGGWFPLVAGIGVFVLMTTWKRGRQLLSDRLKGERLELAPFIESLAMSMPTRVPGTAVFLNADPKGVPHALLHNLMHNKVLHERVVLLSVQFYDLPYVPEIDRIEVKKMRENFWSVVVQYGFMDEPDIPAALERCTEAGLECSALDTSYFIGRETLIPKLDSDMAFWREKLFVALFRNAGSATAYFRIPTNRVVELGTQVSL